jgi:hypothetical protein
MLEGIKNLKSANKETYNIYLKELASFKKQYTDGSNSEIVAAA